MRVIDKGRGIPVVLVPGVQGRWEYLGPAVDALSQSHRVITFSLCDEPGWQLAADPSTGFDRFANQIDAVLADRALPNAVICGISFGGLAALRFAVSRPERTTALILASTPGPRWHLKASHRRYVRFPWLSAPLFLTGMPGRLRGEIAAAIPDPAARRRFVRGLLWMLLHAPVSPSRMAARARLIDGVDNAAVCASVSAPTLVMTGEAPLDHVVPADGTTRYAQLIPGSLVVTLPHTGHLGFLIRPAAFAEAIGDFLKHPRIAARSGQHAA